MWHFRCGIIFQQLSSANASALDRGDGIQDEQHTEDVFQRAARLREEQIGLRPAEEVAADVRKGLLRFYGISAIIGIGWKMLKIPLFVGGTFQDAASPFQEFKSWPPMWR